MLTPDEIRAWKEDAEYALGAPRVDPGRRERDRRIVALANELLSPEAAESTAPAPVDKVADLVAELEKSIAAARRARKEQHAT